MNQLPAIVGDPISGFSLLLNRQTLPYSGKTWTSIPKRLIRKIHPFGLDLPQPKQWVSRLYFVGEHVPEMSVKAFVDYFFWHTNGYNHSRIKRLRVISVPHFYTDKSSSPCQRKQNGNYVFFELWAYDDQVIFSGETTDFSGAGREGCQELEDLFTVFSLVYKVPIERVTIDPSSDATLMVIERLYHQEEN